MAKFNNHVNSGKQFQKGQMATLLTLEKKVMHASIELFTIYKNSNAFLWQMSHAIEFLK